MKFGQKVRDTVTGFEGVVTGKASYITGCTQYTVQPQVKDDGDYVEGRWFDEGRLSLVDDKPITVAESLKDANGPGQPAPIK